METEFTCSISMKCTKEQFNKDLNDELIKIGYTFTDMFSTNSELYICSNLGLKSNVITTFKYICYSNRYFIDHYNPQLFLALVAMTNNPKSNYGEYWKFNIKDCYNCSDTSVFIQNKLYKQNKVPLDMFCSLIDEANKANGFSDNNYQKFKKATKQEIINQFTNKNMENKGLSKFNLSDLKDGNIIIFRNGVKGLFINKAIYI